MANKTIKITEGSDEDISFDNTADGDMQKVKVMDPTGGATSGIGTSSNPWNATAILTAGTIQRGNIAFGSLTGTFQAVLTPSAAYGVLVLVNQMNGWVDVSLDNSGYDFTMEPGQPITIPWAPKYSLASAIGARNPTIGTTPTAGTLFVTIIR